ncbi:hypothetical protein D3C80_1140370 [compost metagenome]
MTGRVQDLDRNRAQHEVGAVGIGFVEHHGVGGHVGGLEQIAEGLLHAGDLLADPDGRAGSAADHVGAGQVVGVGVGFQHPLQLQATLAHGLQHPVYRAGRGARRRRIIVQHRVDDGRGARGGIRHQIGHGVGRGIEEADNVRPVGGGWGHDVSLLGCDPIY